MWLCKTAVPAMIFSSGWYSVVWELRNIFTVRSGPWYMMFGLNFIHSFSDVSPRLWLLFPGQLGAVAGCLGGTGMGGGGRTSTDPDRVRPVEGILVVWMFSGLSLSCIIPKTHSYFITLDIKPHVTPQCCRIDVKYSMIDSLFILPEKLFL